jgi:hypothetical protein
MQALIQHQHKEEIEGPLGRLRHGATVVLSVSDEDMAGRKRVPNPRLVVSSLPSGEVSISLESMGCEIAKPADLKVQWLMKMGLTKKAATVLISEIKSSLLDIRRY